MPRARIVILAAATAAAALLAVVAVTTRSEGQGFASSRIDDRTAASAPRPWGPAIEGATDLAFLPGGDALIARKGGWAGAGTGQIIHVDEDGLNPRIVLELPVCTDAERGLVGMAVDPHFADNGYVYVDYVRQMNNCALAPYGQQIGEGVSARVARFTFDGDRIDPASELVLLDGIDANQSAHVGGGLAFLTDGTLLVGVGEGGSYSTPDAIRPVDPLETYSGKILRIDPSAPGIAPSDNPFASAPYDLSIPRNAIWATGLRNPFKIAVDPSSDLVIATDVGTDMYEELNVLAAGADFGYPDLEGPGKRDGKTEPVAWYRHEDGCSAIIGATIVDGSWFERPDQRAAVFTDFGCARAWAALIDPAKGTVSQLLELGKVGYSASAVVARPNGGIVLLAAGPGEQQSMELTPN